LLGGCVSVGNGPDESAPPQSNPGQIGCYGGGGTPPMVPGVQGPWGQPVPMIPPYSMAPPGGAEAARAMMQRNVPLDLIQVGGMSGPGKDAAQSGVIQAGGIASPGDALSPPGFPAGPGAIQQVGATAPAGAVAAVGANLQVPGPSRFPTQRTEVRFVRPTGMQISWYTAGGDKSGFTSTQINTPGRYNFAQAAIYRLKLSNIEGRPGLVLYPTLEVVPSNSRTDAFLAHSAVPVEFTNEDFDQVAAGNYVVKVIYLPDPNFQDVATTGGLEEIVSSRLEAGTDPIVEAQRRGSILLVIRMGNILLELENTPAMDAPSPYANRNPMAPPMTGPGFGFGMPGPGPMVPYGALNGLNPLLCGPYGPMVGSAGPVPGPGGPVAGANGAVAGPAGPMPRPGPNGLVMGPNGPMIMGPNGPIPVGPNGPLMPPGMMANPAMGMGGGPNFSSPAMLPAPTLPPDGGNRRAAPSATLPVLPPVTGSNRPSGGGTPITRLPDESEIKQAKFSPSAAPFLTTAQLVNQDMQK
jgi:hypothetical protein